MKKYYLDKKGQKKIASFFLKYYIGERNIDKNSLSRQKDTLLISLAKTGDSGAEAEIIESYQWLVDQMATTFKNFVPESSLKELRETAVNSLKKSIKRYNPSADYRFAVFAMEGIALALGIDMDSGEFGLL